VGHRRNAEATYPHRVEGVTLDQARRHRIVRADRYDGLASNQPLPKGRSTSPNPIHCISHVWQDFAIGDRATRHPCRAATVPIE
jgi:hypothetical protein